MMLPMSRLEGRIDRVDHHQFFLSADASGAFPMYPIDGSYLGRLVSVAQEADAVCIETGIAMGTVRLALHLLDAPPTAIDASRPWEVVEEVTFDATDPVGRLLFLLDSTPAPFDQFDLPAGAGRYRVRAHAVGRALDFDTVMWNPDDPERPDDCGPPREQHLLQVWPTHESAVTTRLKADDPWAHQGDARH